MDHRSNCKNLKLKFPKENIREKFCNLGINKHFLGITLKAQTIKESIDKLNLKLKTSSLPKRILRK